MHHPRLIPPLRELAAAPRAVARLGLTLSILASGCGSHPPATHVIPKLPGDGEHPKDEATPGPAQEDPWAGRGDLIQLPPPAPAAALPMPPLHYFTLANGLAVAVGEKRDLPVVEVQLAIRVGGAQARRDNVGIAELAAALLTRGTRPTGGAQFGEAAEQIGARLSSNATLEETLVSCSALAAHLAACLDLLADAVATPAFAAADFAEVHGQFTALVQRKRADPTQLADAHFHNLLWGESHVRGWPMSARTVAALQSQDIRDWHMTWYRPNNAVLTIAGDVDAKRARLEAARAFRRWSRRKLPKRAVYREPTLDGVSVRVVDAPALGRAEIRIGHLGIAHGAPEYAGVLLVDHIVGSSPLDSRLARALGDEPGALSAQSTFDRYATRGVFAVESVAAPKAALAVVRKILATLAEFAEKGPSSEEVAMAKSRLAASYATHFESARSIAETVLATELHRLDRKGIAQLPLEIAALTRGEAAQVAARLLQPENAVVVLVGDGDEIGSQLAAVGMPYERIGASAPVAAYEREELRKERLRPPSPEAVASARAVLDQALAAAGGKAALQAVRTMKLEGEATLVIPDPKVGRRSLAAQVTRYYAAPDQLRRDMKIRDLGVESTTAFDGTRGWAYEKRGKREEVSELPAAVSELLKAQLWRDHDFILLRHRDEGTVAAKMPDEKIDGVAYDVVRITRSDGSISADLYIDKATRLMRRMTYEVQDTETVEDYFDYRDVGGIQIAHRRHTADARNGFYVTIKKVVFNSHFEPALFAAPKVESSGDKK